MIFSKAKGQDRGLIFTIKTQSERGVLSTTLSASALVAGVMSIYQSYRNAGNLSIKFSAVGLMSVLFGLAGLFLGIISLREAETFKLFPIIGLFTSVLSLLLWGFILYLGIG